MFITIGFTILGIIWVLALIICSFLLFEIIIGIMIRREFGIMIRREYCMFLELLIAPVSFAFAFVTLGLIIEYLK